MHLYRHDLARGSSLLEMVLFSPLILVGSMLVIDAALSNQIHSALTDGVRSAIRHHYALANGDQFLHLNHTGQLEYHAEPRIVLEKLSEHIASQIDPQLTSSASSYRITLMLIALDIDEMDGLATNWQILETVSHQHLAQTYKNGPSLQPDSARTDAFLNRLLYTGTSPYALPKTIALEGPGLSGLNNVNFHSRSALLYVNMQALNQGFYAALSEGIGRKKRVFEDHQLFSIRGVLG